MNTGLTKQIRLQDPNHDLGMQYASWLCQKVRDAKKSLSGKRITMSCAVKLRYIPIDEGHLSAAWPSRLRHAQIVPDYNSPRRVDDLRGLREKPASEIAGILSENLPQFHCL